MTVRVFRRMVEISGSEALWLLAGATTGRLVYVQRDSPVIRPAVHLLEYGQLIVRTPAQGAALTERAVLSYHVDELPAPGGAGWSVTASGPAEPVADEDEAAHYRRTLPGWLHGPHDTLLLLRPQTVTGFRLAD
ncbi:pyridoxamine 5'-phosphate oxidase family protein [Streptomyces sp. TP-A0874]|uniref:pyridoxamine 5'-phosphate oxidase family protein n=1 Tax=Streptomyces sp. TP-A0874 TaxID=549819 RepID=UPI001FCE2B86|nr:pyridoxamine 5'-phosphate oxidase family protein [Streptomyces sp. TP-A0874]